MSGLSDPRSVCSLRVPWSNGAIVVTAKVILSRIWFQLPVAYYNCNFVCLCVSIAVCSSSANALEVTSGDSDFVKLAHQSNSNRTEGARVCDDGNAVSECHGLWELRVCVSLTAKPRGETDDRRIIGVRR